MTQDLPSAPAPSRIRVGAVSYLNALPLTRSLASRPDVELISGTPDQVAADLRAGRVEVGLVPVVEMLRDPTLLRVSDAGVAADGKVDSVLLFSRTPPPRLRSVVLDRHSRTSQILTRIVLRDRFGATPAFSEGDPVAAWKEGAEAVLVIGDPALRLAREAQPALDLSEVWRELTGLPFVFAAWLARAETIAQHPGLPGFLQAARDEGLRVLRTLAQTDGPREGLTENEAWVYLTQRIRYRLAASEERGLARFLELARPFVGMRGTETPCSTSG